MSDRGGARTLDQRRTDRSPRRWCACPPDGEPQPLTPGTTGPWIVALRVVGGVRLKAAGIPHCARVVGLAVAGTRALVLIDLGGVYVAGACG